jgi:hypothetical protein
LYSSKGPGDGVDLLRELQRLVLELRDGGDGARLLGLDLVVDDLLLLKADAGGLLLGLELRLLVGGDGVEVADLLVDGRDGLRGERVPVCLQVQVPASEGGVRETEKGEKGAREGKETTKKGEARYSLDLFVAEGDDRCVEGVELLHRRAVVAAVVAAGEDAAHALEEAEQAAAVRVGEAHERGQVPLLRQQRQVRQERTTSETRCQNRVRTIRLTPPPIGPVPSRKMSCAISSAESVGSGCV